LALISYPVSNLISLINYPSLPLVTSQLSVFRTGGHRSLNATQNEFKTLYLYKDKARRGLHDISYWRASEFWYYCWQYVLYRGL